MYSIYVTPQAAFGHNNLLLPASAALKTNQGMLGGPDICSLLAAGSGQGGKVWCQRGWDPREPSKRLMHIKNVYCPIAGTLDYPKRQSLAGLAVPSTSGKWEGGYFKDAGVMERFLLACGGWSRSQLHTYGE